MKIGVAGLGFMGSTHLQAYQSVSNAEIAAVASSDEKKRAGDLSAIQGNLDPVALLTPWPVLKKQVDDVLARAAGRPGHIFNLGHGIFPNVPVDNVRRVVDYVHEQTS